MSGRIRTIKPELREHLPFAELDDRAARLFLMLYTLVDDDGRCPAGAAFLAGAVFFARPCAANVIGNAITALERARLVARYEVNGAPYLEIVDWHTKGSVTHQRIEKYQGPRYPVPGSSRSGNRSGNHSGGIPAQTSDLRPPTGTPTGIPDRSSLSSPLAPDGWEPPADGEWIKAARQRRGQVDYLVELEAFRLKKLPALLARQCSRDEIDRAFASWLLGAHPHAWPRKLKPTWAIEDVSGDRDALDVPREIPVPRGDWVLEDNGDWYVYQGHRFSSVEPSNPDEKNVVGETIVGGRRALVFAPYPEEGA